MKPLVSRWIRMRLAIVGGIYLAALGLVLARAFDLQVLDRSRLAALAERQHTTEIQVAPRRGPIYDRQMQELAVSVQTDSIYARPGEIQARRLAASRLAAALGLDVGSLSAKLEGKSPFVWVKRLTTPSEAQAVEALHIPGVGFVKEGRRYYPHRTLAAKLLGFVGMDGEGLEGIERRFDGVLRGRRETVAATRDAAGRPIMDRDAVIGDSEDGRGIVLSIDEAIQYIAETELDAAVQHARAKHGVAIVMDPRTGDILALAEWPRFNPNVYGEAPPAHRQCLAFSTTFEPGSTFKLFVVAAAIEEGAVRPSDRIYCENGRYGFAGRLIHDVHPYGWLDVADVVKHSSNIGALKIADRLGKDRLYRYIRAFGFGSPSGADFPSDLPGLLPPLRRWSRITQGTIAFGQGIAVTPIQLAAAVGVIANGGILMRPRLVTAEVSPEGHVLRRIDPVPVRRVVSEETARTITGFMKRVTEKGGTGVAARTPGYAVAGKTGTAQKVKEGVRGYSSKRIGSFVGFVPADDPRIVIVVVIDEPTGVPYGGVVAAPAFRAIAEKTLTYLNVPPDLLVPDTPSKKTPTLEVKEEPRPGGGRETRRRPSPTVTSVALQSGVPDFTGLSMREALQLAGSRDLEMAPEGSGVAVSQEPPPGAPVTPGLVLHVRFSLPGSS